MSKPGGVNAVKTFSRSGGRRKYPRIGLTGAELCCIIVIIVEVVSLVSKDYVGQIAA
jgi:hypothetical protein